MSGFFPSGMTGGGGLAHGGLLAALEWNQSTDTWTVLQSRSLAPWLDQITRVNLAADGTENAEHGDAGYTEDGTNGRVMVRLPRPYYRTVSPAANVYQWYIRQRDVAGYDVHPAFVQRDNVGTPTDFIYVGAYEADLVPDAAGAHQLHSRAGFQPMTGRTADTNAGVFVLDFDAGDSEPAIGDTVQADDTGTGGTGDEWIVLGYELESGAWGGTGVGKLWLRQPGNGAPTDWNDNDIIANNTQSNTLGNQDGAVSVVDMNMDNAEDWANEIGAGWGITNIWTWSLVKLLMMMDWGNLDSQTELGRGIVDKASGSGFNGELTGAFNINDNLNAALTGAGDDGLAGQAQDGLRPVAWRGIENPWGGTWQYVIGYNSTDAEYRIIKKAGVADVTMAATLAGGTYDASDGPPLGYDGYVNGYISNIEWESLLDLLFIPSAIAGDSSSYIPDNFWSHNPGATRVLRAGGCWLHGADAGAGCLASSIAVSYSDRYVGARLEWIPQ